MSDERRKTAVALPGEPASWRATVRDLLRHLRVESPEREAAVDWLREEGATNPDADEQLAFLDDAGIVDAAEGHATPGPHGREFLDTHDEGVLYEALTSAVGGFETLLESLAVRPLTDVEFLDLLEAEFDADLGSTDPVLAHRQWLQALGYADHDGGVNDLTRAGRLRVETDDGLTPPRANRSGDAARGGTAAAGVEQSGSETTRSGASAPAGPELGDGGGAGSAESPEAADGNTSSVGTDEEEEKEVDTGTETDGDDRFESLKRRYDYTCAICGDRRRRAPGEGHALVYHPMPPDEEHGGPAEPANAVVACPNHYADLKRGLLRIDPRTREIDHAYESAVSGRTLATVDGHDLGAQYLAYHNEVVAEF